jgi:hypothetical protein
MPKPKSRGVGGKVRRAAPTKGAAKTRKPKARAAKPLPRKGRAVAPKKRPTAKSPAKPAPPAAKGIAPARAAAASTATLPVTRTEKKEGVRMADQAKCPIHGVPDCFKPALDAYVQQAYDGYCTKIDWPFVRIIPKGWKPGK